MSSSFQRISFDEANPALTGAIRGMELMQMPAQFRQRLLQNQKLQELMPYLAPQAAAQLQQTKLQNKRQEKILPYAESQAFADALSKIVYSQYMGSPGLAQKYLTPEGKTYTEPGVVRQVQGQIQNNPFGNALNIMRGTGAPIPSYLQGINNNNEQHEQQPQEPQQAPPLQQQQSESNPTPQNMGFNQNDAMNNVQQQNNPQQSAQDSSSLNFQLTPQQQINEEYNLQRLKNISDPVARQKALYALNIDKSLAFIKPKDLLVYSGLGGSLKHGSDLLQALAGSPPERLLKYSQSATTAKILADQIRQFYGTSVRDKAVQKLENLTNPEAWYRNEKTAETMFNQGKKVLQNESKTYRDAFSLRSVYDNPAVSPASTSGSKNAASSEEISIISPDGKRGTIPINKLDLFLKNGYKRG